METRWGRTVDVTRFAPWGASLWTRRAHHTTRAGPGFRRRPGKSGAAEVVPIAGDAFGIRIRGRVLTVGQPLSGGGKDIAPTPVELFVAAVTSCTAHYAGRCLDRHGVSRDGLSVRAEFGIADDGPAPGRLPRPGRSGPRPAAAAGRSARGGLTPHTVTNTRALVPEVVLEVRCDAGQVTAGDTEADSA
ncbi:OsmC family protein [Streptomyces sp. QTS137]